MSSPSLLGRSSVRAAVERVLDEVDESLKQELKRSDNIWRRKYDDLEAEANDMRQRLAKTEAWAEAAHLRLEDDSRSLRQTISEMTTEAAHVSAEKEPALSDQSAALKKSLEHALARYENAKKNRDALVDVARRRKTEVKKWIEYAESLERKIKRLEKKVADKAVKPEPLDTADQTGSAAAPADGSSGATADGGPREVAAANAMPAPADVQKPSLSASFRSSFSTSFLDGGDLDRAGDDAELPSRPSNAAAATTSNVTHESTLDSTQGDPSSDEPSPAQEPELPTPRAVPAEGSGNRHGDVRVKQEPLSDGPEIVWERPVKRQRRDEAPQSRSQHRATDGTTRVKREPADNAAASWPASSAIRESQESLDLDEGQLAMPTPRKRRLVFHGVPSQNNEESPGLSQRTTQDRAGETLARNGTPLATLSVNVPRGSRAGAASAKKEATGSAKQSKRGVDSLLEGGRTGQPRTQQQAAASSPSLGTSSRLRSMLHQTPQEIPRFVWPKGFPEGVGRSEGGSREDAATVPPRARPGSYRRTWLLQQTQRDKPAFVWPEGVPRESGGSEGESREGAATVAPGISQRPGRSAASPSVAAPGATLTWLAPLTATPLAAKYAATSAAKNAPPLRERALDQLTLQDFKINPARNDGASFAYNEVVRSRSDRGTLAGCTDPQCCGKVFRAMASSELAAVPSAKGASAGSPGASAAVAAYINRPDSIVTMEKYLGEEAYVLARMSPAEKQDLWMDARTHELANKYGKHRHRFHRRASPPGFWDADFPTSQEEERYRAESAKQEKAVLLERYREAMRPGKAGRWLFRDE